MAERLILIAWATVAAGIDARCRRLPNWLTLGGLVVGSLYAVVFGTSFLGGDAIHALLSAVIGFVALFPLYLAGWMGAGDVKLFTAMGMLGGDKVMLPALLAGSLIAGLAALVLIALKRGQARGERPVPFGIGLAVGFILAVLDLVPTFAWKG